MIKPAAQTRYLAIEWTCSCKTVNLAVLPADAGSSGATGLVSCPKCESEQQLPAPPLGLLYKDKGVWFDAALRPKVSDKRKVDRPDTNAHLGRRGVE